MPKIYLVEDDPTMLSLLGTLLQMEGFQAMPEATFMDRVVPAHAIGAACMAINLGWLRDHWATVNPEPWFQFVHAKDNNWLGEDLSFCLGVQKRGGSILVDGRVKCLHRAHGEYV